MKKAALIILDGFGYRTGRIGNAVANAKKPCFDFCWKHNAHTLLGASGAYVGLPKNTLGGSEVGHYTIGAGRIAMQELTRINNSIKDRSFFSNKVLVKAMRGKGALHIIGLVSDGGIHSHISHLLALIRMARQFNKQIFLHIITDGRDVEPKSAKRYIKIIEQELRKNKIGKIATVVGRYYAMDRDNRWNRTEKAYSAMLGINSPAYKTAADCIDANYRKGVTDEFIFPATIADFFGINEKDSVLFFNFRSDRAKQLTNAFMDRYFMHFKRKRINLNFYCMCNYTEDMELEVAFPQQKITNSLGEIIAKKGMSQLRVAETEKFPHVTYFFSCDRGKPFRNQEEIEVPSPKVATYDMQPEMSSYIIAEKLIERLLGRKTYNFMLLNFANPDMVGHCGAYKPAMEAVEHVDRNLKRVIEKLIELKYNIIITADHGNAEEMTGKHRTSHTMNPVPCILILADGKKNPRLKRGGLENIAPTILKMLGIKKPKEMRADSLF